MEFGQIINYLNALLQDKNPTSFNGSWIKKHAPRCHSFIQRNIRTETGSIDWDKVTYALEWKFQRRWAPGYQRKNRKFYRKISEARLVLEKIKKNFTSLSPRRIY
jgi:hypothetical protein